MIKKILDNLRNGEKVKVYDNIWGDMTFYRLGDLTVKFSTDRTEIYFDRFMYMEGLLYLYDRDWNLIGSFKVSPVTYETVEPLLGEDYNNAYSLDNGSPPSC